MLADQEPRARFTAAWPIIEYLRILPHPSYPPSHPRILMSFFCFGSFQDLPSFPSFAQSIHSIRGSTASCKALVLVLLVLTMISRQSLAIIILSIPSEVQPPDWPLVGAPPSSHATLSPLRLLLPFYQIPSHQSTSYPTYILISW